MTNLPESDWLLSSIVSTINSIDGWEIGVTLTVSGQLISGLIISGKAYAQHLSEKFSLGSDAAQTIGGQIASALMDKYSEKSDESDPTPVGFIHLKNVKMLNGTQWVNIDDVVWRGRLSAVEGFIFGN